MKKVLEHIAKIIASGINIKIGDISLVKIVTKNSLFILVLLLSSCGLSSVVEKFELNSLILPSTHNVF